MEIDSNYFKCPRDLILRSRELEIAPHELALLATLLHYAQLPGGQAFPSFKKLGEILGRHERKVRVWAASLERKGLLAKPPGRATWIGFDLAPLFEKFNQKRPKTAGSDGGKRPKTAGSGNGETSKAAENGRSQNGKAAENGNAKRPKTAGKAAEFGNVVRETSLERQQQQAPKPDSTSAEVTGIAKAVVDVFSVSEKQKQDPLPTADPVDALIRTGVSQNLAQQIANEWTEEQVHNAIAHTTDPVNKIDNPGGCIAAAFRNGYNLKPGRAPGQPPGKCPVCGSGTFANYWMPTTGTPGARARDIGVKHWQYTCGCKVRAAEGVEAG